MALDEFLVGPQQTSLAPDELIIEVMIPLPAGKMRLRLPEAGQAQGDDHLHGVGGGIGGTERRRQDVREGDRRPRLAGRDGDQIDEFRKGSDGQACDIGRDSRSCATSPGAMPAPARGPGGPARGIAARWPPFWRRARSKTRSRPRPARTSRRQRSAKKKTGKGIAGAIYSMTPPGFPNPCAVNMQMREDGSVVVQIGVTEMGQGSATVLTQMTAEALAVPYEQVTIYPADTGHDPVRFRHRQLARHFRRRQRGAQGRRSGEGGSFRRGLGEAGCPQRQPDSGVRLREGQVRSGPAHAHRRGGPVRPFRA